MYPSDSTFVETMCSRYGVIRLIDYHSERLNRTRHEVFGSNDVIDLAGAVHPDASEACLKVRVVYGAEGITEITSAPYSPRQIHTLRLVYDDLINYQYKSTDRTRLQSLSQLKGCRDEVLIVRNGLITDTSYTNVAVHSGNRWLTPRLPLLEGTRRASLLDLGIIEEADIRPEDIPEGTEVMLFNAMMDFDTCRARIME